MSKFFPPPQIPSRPRLFPVHAGEPHAPAQEMPGLQPRQPEAGTAAGRQTQTDSGTRASFYAALLLTLVVFSRAVEYPGLQSLRLGAVAFAVCPVLLLIGHGLPRVLREKITWMFFGLSIWLFLGSAFGIWRGGSFDVLTTYWSRGLITYLVFAGAATVFGRVETMLRIWIVAMGMMCIYAQLFGVLIEGRLSLGSGFFSNPNDLAAIIVISLPLCWYVTRHSKNVAGKLFWLAITALLWVVFVRTGSRGGFIGLAVVSICYFLMASSMHKLRLLLMAAVIIVAAVLIAPDAIVKRFVSFSRDFSLSDVKEGEDIYAFGSTDSRIEMAQQGVMITGQHPIFGVGPGNFKVSSSEYFKSLGLKPSWTDVHNTYLQFSSENGIPALLIYLILLVLVFRRISRVVATVRETPGTEGERILDAAKHLRLCLIGYSVSAAFGNYAYLYHFFVLSGFVVALHFSVPAPPANRVEAGSPHFRRLPSLASR